MPAGVSTFTYVKFATAALLSMLAGEHLPAPLFHLKKNFSLYNLWGGDKGERKCFSRFGGGKGKWNFSRHYLFPLISFSKKLIYFLKIIFSKN